ncbi:ATP-NAD kinase family protein [Thermodesulfobacteriota bacterium]
MRPVGIIANPASGKDIRRLVAHGIVVPNHEKVNIVKRVLLGLDSMGVRDVFIMPDNYGIGKRAQEALDVSLTATFLEMLPLDTQDDSIRAAALLSEMGVACIVTLGGDGTNRVVAKTCGSTPLISIATGTNNAFCSMIEGTLAGIAAGVVAADAVHLEEITTQAPRLEVWSDGQLVDIALVDVVVSSHSFVASRAVWEVSSLKEVFLTRADPANIGFSSLGGYLCQLPPDSGKGLHIRVGGSQTEVRAPIAPGLVRWVPIESHRIFEPGETIPIRHNGAAIALDGEREIVITKEDRLEIRLNAGGPLVVDLGETLRRASHASLFLRVKR